MGNQLLLNSILASKGPPSPKGQKSSMTKLNFLWSIVNIRVWGTIFGGQLTTFDLYLASIGPKSHKGLESSMTKLNFLWSIVKIRVWGTIFGGQSTTFEFYFGLYRASKP